MFEKKRLLRFGLLMLYAVLLFFYIFRYYSHGRIISGGEGAYFIDYISQLRNYGFSWLNSGTGIFATSLNFGYIFHLALLQYLIPNERVINFVVIYSIFFLPFLAMYTLAGKLKAKPILAFMISVFYVFNPFSLVFLQSLNQWNMLAAYILPSFTYLILRFYKDNLKLFLIFGVHSFVFAFTNANPPSMVLYQVALVIITIFVSLFQDKEPWSVRTTLGKYLVVFSSFILFNLWWILHWFYVYKDAQVGYTAQFALNWLKDISQSVPVTARTLNLEGLLPFPAKSTYDFLSQHYSLFFSHLILVIPVLIITYVFLRFKRVEKNFLFLLLSFALISFLSKGIGGIFGRLYEFMILHIPTFSIFKSANEKWGILLIFLEALILLLSFEKIENLKYKKLIYIISGLYLTYISIPFVTGNIISDYQRAPNFIGSRFFIDKKEYINLRKGLNGDNKLYRVLSFSGSNNYQVALHIKGDKYYTGNDPILSNTNKPFIAPYNGSWTQHYDFFYKNISDDNYLRLLGLFNIGKVVINRDMYPWFGFAEKESIEEIEKILNKKLVPTKGETIDTYDTGNSFLPRFYIPVNLVPQKSGDENILDALKRQKNIVDPRIAIIPNTTATKISFDKKRKTPKIIFTQINPAKYRIRIEGAEDPFLLIFSESFHKSWKLYRSEVTNSGLGPAYQAMNNYFNGAISETISPFKILDANFSETWGKNPLSEDKHLLANGFANSWYITPEDMGGSKSYELVVEFWPQRLFYIGILITFCAFLLSLIAIFIRVIWRISRKKP